MGPSGWLAIVLLVASASILAVLCVGCTPAELQHGRQASTLCNIVERAAGGAVVTWESQQEAPIVAAAEAAPDLAALQLAKDKLAEQRARLKIATGLVDGLDFACNALASAVKIAGDTKAQIPVDVINLVLSSVAKLVKGLVDLGVTLPPLVLQLAQLAASGAL